ncbi:MAG: hypothetical protein KC912_21225 [Proteobacteria bacterium]|nr:hypothetical protein [Pseudomonadota bacterium]
MAPLITLLAFSITTADAQEDDQGWATHGELREMLVTGTDFAVDAEGTTIGQGVHLDQRLRVGLTHTGMIRHFETEWDLFTGQLAGDVWDIEQSGDERRRDVYGATQLKGFQPRKLSYGGYVGNASIDVGLMTSNWGMGLLANDGNTPPLFGREDFGDRVMRVQVSLLPFKDKLGSAAPTYLVFAFDTVYNDDLANIWEGQLANQLIAAVLHDPGEDELTWGAYGVFRNQFEPGFTRSTQAGVVDGYGRLPVVLNDALALNVEAEGVTIVGRTSRAQSYASPQGLAVRAGAIVAKTELEHELFTVHLNGGYATGDGRPDDKHSLDFTADRDFGVGMVLFDEVMGGIEAGTHALLTDPQYSGQAPDGVELVANEGAWRRSTFVQPAVTVRPIDQLEVRAGAVFARSTAPIAQPFYSFRAGGVPRNHLNQEVDGRAIGTELDWAIRFQPLGEDAMEDWTIKPSLEVQGGHALMSEAMGGGTVSLIQSAIRIGW